VVPARADELLDRFDLGGAASRPVRTYSGGMRRRLDLAAALVHRPPVLFLDEPTTGLDPRSRRELWAVIGELVAEGTTLLLTTQYLEEADRLADRVAVVDNGRVIAEGSAEDLKSRLGTTLEVGLSGDGEAERAVGVLGPLGAAGPQRDGAMVRLEVSDGSRALVDVLSALVKEDLAPVSLAIREASLDDVFLAITGHRTEGAGGDDQAPSPAGDAR
jgi:ABC-2 type transport system ATP-binding protein